MTDAAANTPLNDQELEQWRRDFEPRATKLGQGHVLAFWDQLSSEEKSGLIGQLKTIDIELVQRLTKTLLKESPATDDQDLIPVPVVELPGNEQEEKKAAEAIGNGEEALRAGRIGAFVVAGGQGTRLGFSGPKGTYKIGPVTDRTLFQLHAEKIAALRKRFSATIPWVIMTSSANDEATKKHMIEQNYYGLGADSVRIIMQENMPAVAADGKMLLSTRSSLALSPNGHGGSIKALYDSGAVDWLREQGVDTLFYFQVDNVLTQICDPYFLGHHLSVSADMSSKVVRKRDWKEPVGVIGKVGGKLGVIEYSDIPDEVAQQTTDDGKLVFWAGSIAIHILSLDFVARLNKAGFSLPYHLAKKAVPCVDKDGNPEQLEKGQKNGIKFETFVFDALGQADASATVETAREADFGPVKNATGEDSVETARAYLVETYAQWLKAAGHTVPRTADGKPDCVLEISPLTSLDGTGLEKISVPAIKPGDKVSL